VSKYVMRRLMQAVPILIGITLVNFFIVKLAPGNPLQLMIDPTIDPAEIVRAEERLGLNKPIIVQYFAWLRELMSGNLGYAIKTGRPVAEIIGERLSATFLLATAALVLSFVVAIPVGVYSAVRKYSATDYILTVLSLFGISVPSFFLGLGLIYICAIKLGLLPTSGFGTFGADLQGGQLVWDRLRHMFMPMVVLAFGNMAMVMRHTRSSMIEVMGMDFVRTARAKGLGERVVLYKHGLRNALIPVITVFGLSVPRFFAGSFVVETIFAWPGIGRLGVEAIWAREYPVVMGLNLLLAVLVLAANLAADVLYAVVNPQIRCG